MGPAPYPGTVTGPIPPQSAAFDEISRAGRAYCHCPGSLPGLVLAEISPVFRKRGEGAAPYRRTATAPVLCLTLFSPKSPPFSGREGRGHAVHPVLSRVPFLPRARLLTKSPTEGGECTVTVPIPRLALFSPKSLPFSGREGRGHAVPRYCGCTGVRRHFLLTELFRREKSRTFQDCCPVGFWPGMPGKGRETPLFSGKIQES